MYINLFFMVITEEKLQKLLKMVALDSDKEERKKLVAELNQLVNWVEKIKEVDVSKVSAFTTMSIEQDRLAEGPPMPALQVQEALANGPKHDGAYFCVPATQVHPVDEL